MGNSHRFEEYRWSLALVYYVFFASFIFACLSDVLFFIVLHCVALAQTGRGVFLSLLVAALFNCLVLCITMAAEDMQQAYERAKPNPCVGVADLESGLEDYFKGKGDRCLQAVLAKVTAVNHTWKTAPKAFFIFFRLAIFCIC